MSPARDHGGRDGRGSGSPTFILVQKGEALSVANKGSTGRGAGDGHVKGDEVTIEYKVEGQGEPSP